MSKKTWAHLHLPKLREFLAGGHDEIISIKVPGERIDYVSRVALKNAEFKVSEAGRQRCLRENVRNVHAWVVGERVEIPVCFTGPGDGTARAIYDPWKGDSFVDAETLEPVYNASLVYMEGKDVFYV